MRWDELFADLDAQAEALETAERAGEIDERTRIEVGGLALVDRLRAALDTAVHLRLLGGHRVSGRVIRLGPDWLLLDEDGGREALVALVAVLTVSGLGRWVEQPGSAGAVTGRLTIRHVLRGIARDRSPVQLQLIDGSAVSATLDRIGADHVDAALHAPGELRRRAEVRGTTTMPIAALAVVRRVS